MSPDAIVQEAKQKFTQAVEHLEDELKKIRTGRAHPSMLDGVMVEAYETQMPLIQVGSISVPEPQQLQITPFDPNNLPAISKAIRENQSLGLNPMDDGKAVRVPIPPLTEERRQEYAKLAHKKLEDTLVSCRNARHDAMKLIDEAEKDKDLGEDEANRIKERIDNAMAETKSSAEQMTEAKEKDIMTV